MVVFCVADLLGEAEGCGDLQLHFRTIFRITATALGLPVYRHSKGIIAYQLLNILLNAVCVAELFFFELFAHLVAEFEGDPSVHNRLTAQHVPIIVCRNVDVGKHLLVGTPMEH